jgi:hypothetical protein
MSRMALVPWSAADLEQAPTLFASFMGEDGDRYRTVDELRAIYHERSLVLAPARDDADDLRVARFAADMAGGRWHQDVVMRIGEFGDDVLVVDGIHRGIAYLSCIDAGVSAARLPALHVQR